MKKLNIIALFFALMLTVISTGFTAGATEFDAIIEYELSKHTVQGYLIDMCGYDEAELLYETIDNVDYIYTVLDGEASIVNVHNQYRGKEKIVFTFPTTLGGYPVTTIGDSERQPEVFWYINYGEEIEFDFEYFPEYDPACKRYDLVEIPEGYEYIKHKSLYNLYALCFSFPASLKVIYDNPFDKVYSGKISNNENTYFIMPDCEYKLGKYAQSFLNSAKYWFTDTIVLPSRNVNEFSMLSSFIEKGAEITYLPSNISSDNIEDAFYYFDAAVGDNGQMMHTPIIKTFHCAPDSEFLSVFEKYGGHNTATIITDVTPAEYIEFPDETVNVHVGDVVDLEAKTYPTDAIWTACDYEVSDPSIVKIDEYSGRITALKEGTVTVTATHCERGFVDTCTVNVVPEPVPGVNEIKPATDTPYYSYGNRDYTLDVTGSPSKIQVVRDNGGTTTIDRRRATVTSNGETETWVVNMRVEAGTHNIRAKYGTKWDERLTPFTVTYDTPPTPKAYSFDLGYENGLGTFEVVTDPQIIKVQFLLDNGCTLTYSQSYSYVAEDGLRHWVITRKIPANTRYTLKTKLGYVWTTTDLTVTS